MKMWKGRKEAHRGRRTERRLTEIRLTEGRLTEEGANLIRTVNYSSLKA